VNPGSIWQVALHPSPETTFPSSHCSPLFTEPSPQRGTTFFVQGRPGTVHEYPGSTWHIAEQPSPSTTLPSSQASVPSMIPSPHFICTVEMHGTPAIGHVEPGSI
jgi:hypothetical protein